MAVSPLKNGHLENWLPLVDALRNQFAEPSKQIMDTIVVAQSQVKNGFLAAVNPEDTKGILLRVSSHAGAWIMAQPISFA